VARSKRPFRFANNFKQTRHNHAAVLNRKGAKFTIPHFLIAGEGEMSGQLVSNLAKAFRSRQSLAFMLAGSLNETACR
jgi:hypothetical protein